MCVSLVLLVSFQMMTINSAPLIQMMPLKGLIQRNIQEQISELQALQQYRIPGPIPLNNPIQPLLFFIPDDPANMDSNRPNEKIDNEIKLKDQTDEDSIAVDAEPIPILEDQKAMLVLPNGRLSIGQIISAIPFLPIEINVPDTISWAYNGIANGIAGIISIIGQRWPFQRPSSKTAINDLRVQNDNSRPIVMLPLDLNRQILPVPLENFYKN